MKSSLSHLTNYESIDDMVELYENSKNYSSVAKPKDSIEIGGRRIDVYEFPSTPIKCAKEKFSFGRSLSCQFLTKALQELCEDPCQKHLNFTKNSAENQVIGGPGVQGIRCAKSSISPGVSQSNHSSRYGASAASKDSGNLWSPSSLTVSCGFQMIDQESTNDYGKPVEIGPCHDKVCRIDPHWVVPSMSPTSSRVVRLRSEHSHTRKKFRGISRFEHSQENKSSNEGHKATHQLSVQNPLISDKITTTIHGDGLSIKPQVRPQNNNINSNDEKGHSGKELHEFSKLSLRELRQVFEKVDHVAENAMNKVDGKSSVPWFQSKLTNDQDNGNDYANPIYSYEKHDRFLHVYAFGDTKYYSSTVANNEEDTFHEQSRKTRFGMIKILLTLIFLVLYSSSILLLQFYAVEQKRQFWATIHEWGDNGSIHEEEGEPKDAMLSDSSLRLPWLQTYKIVIEELLRINIF